MELDIVGCLKLDFNGFFWKNVSNDLVIYFVDVWYFYLYVGDF